MFYPLYSSYSRPNCFLELYSKALYKQCSCVLPTMALVYANATICGTKHNECVLKHLREKRLKQTIEDTCLLECSELTYTTSTSFAPLNEHSPLVVQTGVPIIDCTVLSIFTSTKTLRSREKRVQMTFTDFICKLIF